MHLKLAILVLILFKMSYELFQVRRVDFIDKHKYLKIWQYTVFVNKKSSRYGSSKSAISLVMEGGVLASYQQTVPLYRFQIIPTYW